jgi:hypothetical protein
MIDPKDMIDALILEGALEIQGIDSSTGQIIYSVTDKMLKIAPEIYHEIEDSIHKTVLSLWEKGFLSMNIMDENPTVSPTEFALDRNVWTALSGQELHIMNTVMMRFEGDI